METGGGESCETGSATKKKEHKNRRSVPVSPGLHSEKEESNIIVKTNLVDAVETGRNVE